ncbi:SNAP protein [Novymonas esmeraldas]|uniref:SNAP protein n=1 Tax=Novymonas esmeraldas TaxID=1808958 RepID=A0AAW0EUW9_9TRYP
MSSADAMFADADKKTKKTFFKDFDGAFELFNKAGAKYKLDKDFMRAGDAYSRAGDCAVKLGDKAGAGLAFADAANAYKRIDTGKAKTMLDMAVRFQIENNRLSGAARLLTDFAASLEEQGSAADALPFYQQAMSYFNAEDQKAQAQKCMIAMGKIHGELDQYDKALMYYERIANEMLGGPLKFQAQDYFLRAMLCRFALVTNDNRFEGSEECRDALQQYLSADIYLKNTREAEFLQLILDAVTDNDVDKFELGVSLLQDIRKLDDWKTHVLLVVKHNMESLT